LAVSAFILIFVVKLSRKTVFKQGGNTMARSKEAAIAAGVSINETQHSMKRRTPWHDYRQRGTYMLTLVVKGRKPLLGRLVVDPCGKAQGTVVGTVAGTAVGAGVCSGAGAGAASVPAASPVGIASVPAVSPVGKIGKVAARVELSALGRAIRDEEIKKIGKFYPMVEVWKLCIMPDHIHMIVRVKADLPEGKHLGQVVRGFKTGCSRAWWRLDPCGKAQGTVAGNAQGTVAGNAQGTVVGNAQRTVAGPGAASVPAASPQGIASAPAVFPAGKLRPVLFERGYCDKLLMHEGQLETWKRYLDDNPRRLAIKRLRPDYFTVINNAEVVGHSCQLVGNRFLLDIPQKMAVIVHRCYTDAEYAEYRRQWLACGEAGGVLVSAAIATREKTVMREAMDRGYHVILLRENGFPPLYKPAGEAFEACTEGRLLQISPWEYHMEHKTITRQQCLMLNKMAEDIVAGE
jgi:hypothetical protein